MVSDCAWCGLIQLIVGVRVRDDEIVSGTKVKLTYTPYIKSLA